jgi:phenylalanyl-tRNA synthetase alpha chain
MSDDIQALTDDARARIAAASDAAALETLRVDLLGKKGRFTELMKTLGTIPADQRKARGAALNVAKGPRAASIRSAAPSRS